MGKIRTRVLGMEEVEKEQKEKQKQRSEEKKLKQSKEEQTVSTEKKEVKAKEEKSEVKKEAKKKPTQHRARGKAYKKSKSQVETGKQYKLSESISYLKKIQYAQFDESVELHFTVDEVGLKGEVALPHGTGKAVRVAIVSDALLSEIEKGQINFDVLVTHPSFMPKLSRFAKTLGPKGLMPNPKAGTISTDPESVVKKFQKGTVRWKTEAKFPLIHQMIGKSSYEEKDLAANATAMIQSVGKAHIKKVVIKTTMSPSLKLDLERL